MKRNRIAKRAFTLIELLVVIAIIAILAAILFPVFAQAKLAAKAAASLSNVKQLGTGNQLYYNDNDDTRMGRQTIDATVCMSWKQASESYRKSPALFDDAANPSGKFYDGFSDQALRTAFLCPASSADLKTTGLKQYHRSYYWSNVFGGRANADPNAGPLDKTVYWDQSGLNLSQVEQPASVADIQEGKGAFTDMGPFEGWTQNVDDNTSWMGAAAPKTGLQWNYTNGKYGDKAMNVCYLDGHAKRTSFSGGFCGGWYDIAGQKVADSTKKTIWNFSFDDIKGLPADKSWMQDNVQGMCKSMPTQFR